MSVDSLLKKSWVENKNRPYQSYAYGGLQLTPTSLEGAVKGLHLSLIITIIYTIS